MKLRPPRLPSSSTIEANGTSDQNDHRNDDTAKTKLGSLWRKAKREALSLSPRAKTTEDLQPTDATLAPVVAEVDNSKETNSTNSFPSSSNADAVRSPRVKRKQSPRANDECALLKHRLPKKQSKTESPITKKNVEPSTFTVPPVEANAPTEEKQVSGGRPPIHSRRSTISSRHSSSAVTMHPTSPLSESSKTCRASPKMHSQNSSCSTTSRGSTRKILPSANTQHNANRTKQDELAVSVTSDASSMVTANKGETTSPSLKINSQDSSCSKTSRRRSKKTLSSVSNQQCANDTMQDKRAVSGISDTASTATAKKDGGEKKKKKSALQQFREDEAAKALERARMKEDVKEIETKQRLEDEKNGRWWLLEGLGVGIVNGVACRTKVEQVESDQENKVVTPKASKAEGDLENKILTPKASNATPRNKKKDLFAKGEFGDEGFEVTTKRKPKAKAGKISTPATKAGVNLASKSKNINEEKALSYNSTEPKSQKEVQKQPASTVKSFTPLQPASAKRSKKVDMEHVLSSKDTALKCRSEVKKKSASTHGVKSPTVLQPAPAKTLNSVESPGDAKLRKSISSQQKKAAAKSNNRIKTSGNITSEKQQPSKNAVNEKSPDSTPARTKSATRETPNNTCASKDASEQRKMAKSIVPKSKSSSSSSKVVSQKKKRSAVKESTVLPEAATSAKESVRATMSPKSKSLRRRQKLGVNSLTENETDGSFPDAAAYTSPRYGCFGSEAIIPDATSEECEAAFPLSLHSVDMVGGELVREASNTIGKVLNIDPNKVKMNIERMVLTPQSAKGMNIDRVVVTENVDATHKCFPGGVTNWFRDRGESEAAISQPEKVDIVFGDIQDDDDDRYPLSPSDHRSSFCNATSCCDMIRFREEFALDDDREFVIRNIASIFSADRETIGAKSFNADSLDDIEDDSDAHFEGDLEYSLGDETEEEFEEDIEDEFGLDADTTFGEGTTDTDEEDGDDFETESETEDSEGEFFTFDEDEYTDSETDFDSGSASTSSTVSRSVDGSEGELSDMMTREKYSTDRSWMPSSKLVSSTVIPKKLHPTPVIVNSPISEDQYRSIGGTSTFESNYSMGGGKTTAKNIISTFFKRSVSRVDIKGHKDTNFTAEPIEANESFKSFKSFTRSEDISHANQGVDVPPQVLCTIPHLTSGTLSKEIEKDGGEVKRTPSSSSMWRASTAGESSESIHTFDINANTSTKSSVLTQEISPDLDKIEVSFSIASDVDQARDFSQGVSIVTANEVLEVEGGHEVEHTSFELIYDQVTSVSISTSLENDEGEKSINNQEGGEHSTSEPADKLSAAENPPATESPTMSPTEEVTADLEMEERSTPGYLNTDGRAKGSGQNTLQTDIDVDGLSEESCQDARVPTGSVREDSSNERKEEDGEVIKVITVEKNKSFDCNEITSNDAFGLSASGADISLPTMSKVFPRRKSRKMGSFFMGRSQSKPDKRPLVVDIE